MAHGFRDLIVWQKAMDLVEDIYRLTSGFPREEVYGLTSQMRRAAVSIPSNVAEGQGRLKPGEFRQFLGQARGSLLELSTQTELARRLGFLQAQNQAALEVKAQEVLRMLSALISKLETRNSKLPQ
jgi:four helix bundle protein